MVTSSGDGCSWARRRASFGVLISLSVFLLFVVSCSGSETSSSGVSQEEEVESATDQPNIIFVLTDDLDLASVEKMPEINSLLAEEGATFGNAFISHPICWRASWRV